MATNWVPWAVGAGVLGAWWLLSGTSKGASSSAEPIQPLPGSCLPIDKTKFEAWLVEKQLAGNTTNITLPFPSTYEFLVTTKLAPADLPFGRPYVLVLGNGEFWYYKDKNSAPVKSPNLMNQYCAYVKSLAGARHPADFFMV